MMAGSPGGIITAAKPRVHRFARVRSGVAAPAGHHVASSVLEARTSTVPSLHIGNMEQVA